MTEDPSDAGPDNLLDCGSQATNCAFSWKGLRAKMVYSLW